MKYPPASRIALLLLKGRNEEKVNFSATHVKQEIEKIAAAIPDLTLAGPAPAPLARAETYYRFQIMLRTRHIPKLSRMLAAMFKELKLPEDVALSVDIDPVNMM